MNLAADHRMLGINMMTFQAEDLFQAAHHGLADLGHRGISLPPGLHRGVPQRRLADSRLFQHVEKGEVRTDVERETMVGDPAGDRHAHGGDPRLARENTGQVGAKRPRQIKLVEHHRDRRVQPIQIVRERQAEGVQRQGEIGRELAGEMEHAAAAPIDPVDLDPQRAELLVIRTDVGSAAGPTHADRGRMLAQDQNRPPLDSPRS